MKKYISPICELLVLEAQDLLMASNENQLVYDDLSDIITNALNIL